MDDVVKGGHELIEASHDQSEVIKAKVDEVSQMWSDLVSSSEVKGVKLQVCHMLLLWATHSKFLALDNIY